MIENDNLGGIIDFLENKKSSMRDNDYKVIIEFLFEFKVRIEKQSIEKTYIPYNPLRYFFDSPRAHTECMFCNKKLENCKYYCNFRRNGKCGRIMCEDCSASYNATRDDEIGNVYFISDDMFKETCTHCYLNCTIKLLSEYDFVKKPYVDHIMKFLKIERGSQKIE